jgi:phage regulator Rha-like protein
MTKHRSRMLAKAVEAEIAVVLTRNEPRISHHNVAHALGVTPRSMMQLISDHQSTIEQLGVLSFQNAKPIKGTNGGRPERLVYLNEDQCYMLLTLTRNTAQAIQAKLTMVKAFKTAREQLAQRQTQYLPLHHAAHDSIQAAVLRSHAKGSTTPEKLAHINIEKMLNACFGIAPNSRCQQPPQVQALMNTAYGVVRDIYAQEPDHKTAYQRAKRQVMQLVALTQVRTLGVAS